MELKKYFAGALLLIIYLNIKDLTENIARFIVSDFTLDNMLQIHAIILIIGYIIILSIIIMFIKKVNIESTKIYSIILTISILAIGLKTLSNYLIGNLNSEVYLKNSVNIFAKESLFGGIFNTVLFLILAGYFFRSAK